MGNARPKRLDQVAGDAVKFDSKGQNTKWAYGAINTLHAVWWFMENLEWRQGEDWEVAYVELSLAFRLVTGIEITTVANKANKYMGGHACGRAGGLRRNLLDEGHCLAAVISRIEKLCGGARLNPGKKGKDYGDEGKTGLVMARLNLQKVSGIFLARPVLPRREEVEEQLANRAQE